MPLENIQINTSKKLKINHQRKILIKYGGNAMSNQNLKVEIAKQIKSITEAGIQVILVHGGGPFINKSLQEANIISEFIEGQRVTTKEAYTHIEKTLILEVNADLVSIFNLTGLRAVGLSGKDGKSILAKKFELESEDKAGNTQWIDLGQVGKIDKVDPKLLLLLLENGFTPIITCIAADENGVSYNINGDTFAGEIAAALEVDQFIVLTDVDGLYKNYPDPGSIIRNLRLSELQEHYGSTIQGGMIPKMRSCESAVSAGVEKAVILNGTKPEQLSKYILNNESIGTTIKA